MIAETKLDESSSISQFLIPCFKNPICSDQSFSGGSIILYIREEFLLNYLKLIVYRQIQRRF